MKVKTLIKSLQKLDPEIEVMISESCCNNIHGISDVMQGWILQKCILDYPEFIQDQGNSEEIYGIDPKQQKIACIE